jgi:hypothetical protein
MVLRQDWILQLFEMFGNVKTPPSRLKTAIFNCLSSIGIFKDKILLAVDEAGSALNLFTNAFPRQADGSPRSILSVFPRAATQLDLPIVLLGTHFELTVGCFSFHSLPFSHA